MSVRAWVIFAAVAVLWGFPYLFIKLAIEGGMPPVSIAWGRVALAAAMLLAIAWRAGTLPSLRGRWRWLAIFAVIEIALPFPLIAAGETRIESSTTAIVIATAPLTGALLAHRFEADDRLTRARIVGLLIGFAGVAALVGVHVEAGGGQLLGVGAVLVAACAYAFGAMILKRRLGDLDPVASMGASLALATVVLAPPTAVGLTGASPSAGALASVVVLGVLSTALALVLMAMLVSEVGASRALVVTYVNPAIAVVLGIVFLGESPGAGAVVGLLLILVGSWLSTEGRLPASLRRATE